LFSCIPAGTMPAFMSTRRYVALSLLSAVVVIWHAFNTREQ
jgi:hypothetical protein